MNMDIHRRIIYNEKNGKQWAFGKVIMVFSSNRILCWYKCHIEEYLLTWGKVHDPH